MGSYFFWACYGQYYYDRIKKNKVIKPLMNDGTIKFYFRYVNDTLLVVK